MATCSVTNDMTALLQFLQSDDYTTGHPIDTDVIALKNAINDINNNNRVKEALVVMKTALSEQGWLMQVLGEHMYDAAFERAYKVSVCIYASIKFTTSDSKAPDQPGTTWQDVDGKYPDEYYRTVCGTWQYVDDVQLDDEFKEIWKYRIFRDNLQKYRDFLLNRLASEDRQLLQKCQDKLDILSNWIETIPGQNQLVTTFIHPKYKHFAWCFNTSYFKISSTNKLTRRWLVANLPTIILQMQNYKKTFTDHLPPNNHEEHENLYNSLLTAYTTWWELAAPHVKVPFNMHQQRAVTGNHTNVRALLEELRCIATQNE